MHKSSEHSNDSCVWNEDASTVVSCAYFQCRSLWSSSTAGSFCVPPYRSDGKDTAMKSKKTKNRKSNFNSNRPCCLSADGKFYCYEVYDPETDRVVTQMFEVGKGDYSVEWTIFLDETDHGMDLNDRYQDELEESLFEAKVKSYRADPESGDKTNPWDTISDNSRSPESVLFAEPEPENPDAMKVREVIDSKCNQRQQELFFSHFGEGKQLEQIRQDEMAKDGKEKSLQSIVNVKNDVIKKAADALGVTPVKRQKSKKD